MLHSIWSFACELWCCIPMSNAVNQFQISPELICLILAACFCNLQDDCFGVQWELYSGFVSYFDDIYIKIVYKLLTTMYLELFLQMKLLLVDCLLFRAMPETEYVSISWEEKDSVRYGVLLSLMIFTVSLINVICYTVSLILFQEFTVRMLYSLFLAPRFCIS